MKTNPLKQPLQLKNQPWRTCAARLFAPILASAGLTAHAATFTWDNTGGGSWASQANWSTGTLPTTANDTADFSQLDITAATTVTLDGNQSINQVIFGDTVTNTAFGWVVSAGTPSTSTLTVAGVNPMITVNALGGSSIANITAPVLATNLTIAGPGVFNLGSLSSVISGLTITNGGTFEFGSGANPTFGPLTFTGNGTFSSGLSATYSVSVGPITNAAGVTSTINVGGRSVLGSSTVPSVINGNLTIKVGALVASPSRDYMYGTWENISGAPCTINFVGTSTTSYISPYFNGDAFSSLLTNATFNISSSSAGVNKMYINPHTYSTGSTFNMGALSGTSDGILTSDGTGTGTTYSIGALNTNTTFAGSFQGDCSLVKVGTGALTLSGKSTNGANAANYVSVTAGSLIGVTGGSFITPVFTVASGATFGVQVASAGGQWTGTNMVFQSGSALVFNFGGIPASGTAPLNVLGNLALTNVSLSVDAGNIAPGTYPLIQYGSLAAGSPGLVTPVVTVPAGLGIGLSNGANNTIYMMVTNSAPAITWATNSQTWDIAISSNWDNYLGATVAYQQYSSSVGDPVIFGDLYTPASAITVTLNTNVAPGGVLFSNLQNTYTLSGSGQISGATAVTVSGTNAVIVATTNSYTGGTVVNHNGYLQLSGAGNLGSGQVTLNGGTLFENSDIINNTISNVLGSTSTLTFSNGTGGGYYPTVTVVGGGTLNLNLLGTGVFSPGGTMAGFAGTINVSGGIRSGYVITASTYGSANATWNFGAAGSLYNKYGNQTVYFGALDGVSGSSLTGGNTANGLAATIFVVGNLNTTSTFGGIIQDGSADYTGLTKVGSGALILTGAENYSSPTLVSNGTLEVDGSLAAYTSTTNFAGATLAGTGILYGPVVMQPGSTLAPGAGGPGNYGNLSCSGGLVLNGCTNAMDISTNNGDLITVSGGLNLGSGTIVLNISGALTNGVYPLINYDSITGGSVANLALSPSAIGGQILSLNDNGAGQIQLVVAAAGSASLAWLPVPPGASGDWDDASLNWTNSAAHAIQAFADGDSVTFGDAGGANSSVNLQLSVAPGGIVVNSSSNYTFATTSAGQITGTLTNGLIKSGSGTLTIVTKNNYTGPTVINAGVVQVGDGSTLNTALSSGNVTNNALLVFNQPDNSSIAGTLTGSGSLVQEGAGTLTVEGNSTFTGTNLISTGTLQFGTGGATAIPTNQFVLANGGTLALDRSGTWYVTNGIVGNGGVTFSGPGTNLFGGVNNYVNNTIVAEGTVRLLGPAAIPSGGATTGWLILDGGASAAGTVDLNGYNQTVNELSGLTGTVLGTILNNGGTGTNTLTINTLANEDAAYAGLIEDNSGTGGEVAVVVEGDGTNTFSGANTYSGSTTVYGPATLLVGASGSLGTGMTTLMGGTLGSSVGLLALDGDKVTVPGGTNGLIVMSPNMHLPALYGAGALGIDINGTTPGGHSTSYGDCLSACANFDGVLNVTGMVSTAVLVCNYNQPGGDTFDGQLQNATVNLYAGAGGGVNLAGADLSTGSTVQLGAINVDASSFLGGAALNGTLTYQIGALGTTSDIQGAVSGNGAIIKVGAGELLLNGSDTYTGNTTINAGSVVVASGSFMASSPTITLAAGTVLDVSAANPTQIGNTVAQTVAGSGTVAGNVSMANTTIDPGGVGTVGTLTFSGNLAMTGNSTYNCDVPATGANDQITVTGTLDISGSGNVINLNALNTAIPAGIYTLATFSGGSLLNNGNPVAPGGVTNYVQLAGAIVGQTRNLSLSNSATALLLVVGNGSSLVWSGDGSANQWNLTNSPDWAGGNVFYQDDSVLFNNSSANPTVNVTGTLAPASISVGSDSNYVFASTGKITGNTGIAKSGAGTLTLSNTGGNDYSGQVTITAGTVKAGVATALGSTNGGTVISGTGALDVGGFNLGAEPVTVSGSGSGNGAILNSGAAAINALQYVTLAGDTTFGGPSRWDIRANTNGYLAGNNYNLTKVGTNDIYLVGLGHTALTNILITQGRLGIQDSTVLGTNGTLTLFAGAALDLYLTTVTNTKAISLTNATLSSSDGTNVYAGSINLNGTGYFTATTPLILNGVLGGSGDLVQNGAGTLTLANVETYSGNTTVSNGVLALTGSAALASSPTLDVTAGAVLDASGLSGGLLTLASGQTLEGNGTVNGNVTAAAGSTLTAGEGAIGTLTVTNTLTLAGNTFLKINRDGAPTADEIEAATVNYGGTLTVTNLNLTDPLQLDDSFKLFKGAYNGSFASVILPALPAGLGWANTLSANGSITVVSAPTLGTNDYLATLVVSNNLVAAVGLTPAFATNGYAYYATNTLPASQVNVTVVNEDATATNTLFLNGVSQGQLPSGSTSVLLPLTAGSNNVTVQVVSQDLANTNNYLVNVYDLPSLVSPKLTNSVSGGTLSLSWDTNHLGYRLLMQTNNLSRGISTNGADWGTVPGSTAITATNILIPKTPPTNGFYRLVYP